MKPLFPFAPATLQNLVEELRAANIQVADAYTAYSNARIARNQTLYDENRLKDVAGNVKDYVRSLYGTSHERYRQISALKFTQPKER